jgi:hypothetical protein
MYIFGRRTDVLRAGSHRHRKPGKQHRENHFEAHQTFGKIENGGFLILPMNREGVLNSICRKAALHKKDVKDAVEKMVRDL